ncbi:MAG: hypothetical protein D6731_11670 [Planctomycetota bacterium]|nr:MAG: hypothetical protein D6731_11670 [Planctomycetota bacterium]
MRCTTEHPFWVRGRGWVAAKDLEPGDRLLGSQGEQLVLTGREVRLEEADHYNFEVEDWHTYFVSETEQDSAVWVHNRCRDTNLGRAAQNEMLEGGGFQVKSPGGAQVQHNRTIGNAWRDEVAARVVRNKNVAGVRTEVRVDTPGGPRFVDIEVTLRDGRVVHLETKAGNATRDAMQLAKDRWIEQNLGIRTAEVRQPRR